MKEKVDCMRDVGLIGLGLVSLSRKRADEIAEKLIEASKKSKTEGKKMRKKLDDMAEKGRDPLFSMIRKETHSLVNDMDLVTKEDLADLEKKLGGKVRKKKARKRKKRAKKK
jgi:polyhydroxyalkanoate synthesis regulator phasin